MISMTDIKAVVVEAIKAAPAFADYQENVHPFRALEPGNLSSQVASKLKGLSAFVSIDRIQKTDDRDPVKNITVVIDIWLNPFGEKTSVTERDGDILTLRDGTLVMQGIREAEDVVVEVIDAIEALPTETWDGGSMKQELSFQDAFRMADVPRPFLVYRVLGQTQTVIGNE